jgi:exonuclease III
MESNRLWKILNWNLRGINSDKKWLALASKISESNCDIVCLQETKRESFDEQYLRNFCPKKLNKFEFVPSVGASGGIIIIWNGSLFNGEVDFQNEFSISIKFTSSLSHESWILTNIYGPCTAERKAIFLEWFSNIDMPEDMDWLVLGDFNFMRKPSDRNKPGGDVNEMLLFNEAISNRLNRIASEREKVYLEQYATRSTAGKTRLGFHIKFLDPHLSFNFCVPSRETNI